MQPGRAPARRVRRTGRPLLMGVAGVLAVAWTVPPGVAAEGKRLPALAPESGMVELRGRVRRTTRGTPGPVRVEVVEGEIAQIALLTSDADLEALGLEIAPGMDVLLKGTQVPGAVPMLLVSIVVVEGRSVRIRDAAGRELGAEVPSRAAGGSEAAGAATASPPDR